MSAKFAIVGLLIYLVVFDVANGDDNQCEQVCFFYVLSFPSRFVQIS